MLKKFASEIVRILGNRKTDPVETVPPSQAQMNDSIADMVPDYSLANYVGGGGAEQFRTVGRVMVEWFKLFCDLKPDERVLEVGCGIGRIAIPLTQYLTRGSYVGFDIISQGIDWCRQKVTPRYPNFKFFMADVYNKYYHPEGKQAACEYVFPFRNNEFDFVFLTSVFTHMLPKDLEHYTAEISRVLRPGGRCFCTAYVITAEGAVHLSDGSSRMAFKPYPEGYWTDTPENPEHAVAYPEEYLTRVFQESGLTITRIIPGQWWEHDFAQDIMIAAKPSVNAEEKVTEKVKKKYLGKLRRVASRVKHRLLPAEAPSAQASVPAVSGNTVNFVCNVCGRQNRSVPVEHVQNREHPSCANCRSSLRMRSVVNALSKELFGKPLPLPDFPMDKSIAGLGMSDWEGYAGLLAEKFDYVNTYYHTEPRLDITDIPEGQIGKYRFLISSDVFEHIPVESLEKAFRNSQRLLMDRGVFIFTAPFTKTGQNQEHFPHLHDFRIVETRGKRFLYNKALDGTEEIFSDLIFHGGEGMTLEMRVFSEPDLRRALGKAGFASIQIYTDIVPEFGILWPMDWAVPIAARV